MAISLLLVRALIGLRRRAALGNARAHEIERVAVARGRTGRDLMRGGPPGEA